MVKIILLNILFPLISMAAYLPKVEITNVPLPVTVSGPVVISGAISINPATVSVSNFPTTISVSNQPTIISVSNIPTSNGSVVVSGLTAVGIAPVNNPVSTAGIDGGGLKRNILTDTSGASVVVGSVASGSADSGNPVKIGGVYNSSVQSFTSGNRANAQVSKQGAQLVTADAGFTHITGAVTTVLKSGSGVLFGVYVTNNATNTDTMILYDNTAGSGTIIASARTDKTTLGWMGGVNFSTGLTIVTTGTSNWTITWR